MTVHERKNPRRKKLIQPQEVIVWYVLPAIRRELTNILINTYHLPQKDIAKRFGLTEPAITQYKYSKRGVIDFNPEIIKAINEAARKIAEEESFAPKEVQRVLKFIENNGYLCEIHRKYGLVHEDCRICEKDC
ncbi:MAG: transcriptional regulator [Candidatus Hodarchaeales archaeon]